MPLRIVCAVVLSWFFLAAALPDPGAPWRVNRAACFARQRALAAAVGMHRADHPGAARSITPGFLLELRAGGYLDAIPDDPGEGPGTALNYSVTGLSANRVRCRVHGAARLALDAADRAPGRRGRGAAAEMLDGYREYWGRLHRARLEEHRAWYEPASMLALISSRSPAAGLLLEVLVLAFLVLRGGAFLAELYRDLRSVSGAGGGRW